MNDSSLGNLREILSSHDFPDDEAEILLSDLNSQLESQKETRAIEKAIGSSESYAFFWADILSLESAVDTIAAAVKGEGQIAAVKALCEFWVKLRKMRVELSESETKVLRVVRSRYATGVTQAELIKALPDLAIEVPTIIIQLKSKLYRNEVPLLEEGSGRYTTRF